MHQPSFDSKAQSECLLGRSTTYSTEERRDDEAESSKMQVMINGTHYKTDGVQNYNLS